MPIRVRDVDLRFLLPEWPARLAATALGPAAAGAAAAAGHLTNGPPDAVLCSAEGAAAALAAGVPRCGAVVVGPGASAAARRLGHPGRRWALIDGPAGPLLAVPAGAPAAARAALLEWAGTQSLRKVVRNRAVERWLAAGRVPPGVRDAVVLGADGAWPLLARAAAGPGGSTAFLGFPGSDDLSRVVAVVPGEGRVVKTTRLPGATRAGDADARGLATAATVPAAAARAPRLLERGVLDAPGAPRLPWTVESRGAGTLLTSWLQAGRGRPRRLLADMTDWLVEVARTSRGSASAEVARIRDEVLPRWPQVPTTVLTPLVGLPSVLQHGDLGAWNVVTDGSGFTVLDWEAARPAGLPLWDLLYLLTDALAALDGAVELEERLRHAVRLHRGELPASRLLFGELRRAAAATAVPERAIPPLALTCWLHHAASSGRRATEQQSVGAGRTTEVPVAGRLGQLWVDEPSIAGAWEALLRD